MSALDFDDRRFVGNHLDFARYGTYLQVKVDHRSLANGDRNAFVAQRSESCLLNRDLIISWWQELDAITTQLIGSRRTRNARADVRGCNSSTRNDSFC